jgi:hypothetical protein
MTASQAKIVRAAYELLKGTQPKVRGKKVLAPAETRHLRVMDDLGAMLDVYERRRILTGLQRRSA